MTSSSQAQPSQSTSSIDLTEVFAVEQDRKKFLSRFDRLVRHLQEQQGIGAQSCRHQGGQCHDINQIVALICENLIRIVSNTDLKFEQSLFSIPWAKYLLDSISTPGYNQLDIAVFSNLLVEYVQIFPNKCDKFVENFLFLFRGNKEAGDDVTLSEQELRLFGQLKATFGILLKSIRTFEQILSKAIKKKHPFYHNTNVHEFICYTYNVINLTELASGPEQLFDMLNFVFSNLVQVDMKQFFDEFNDTNLNKENIFEFEETQQQSSFQPAPTQDERVKKFKVLDGIFNLLFEFIDSKLQSDESSSEQLLEVFTSIFFQRLLIADSVHLQYPIFYLCGRSRPYCDALVNDLWTIATNQPTEPLEIREAAFSYLVSLFLNAKFVSLNTVFSFLKIIIQWLNAYIDTKHQQQSEFGCESDVMYFNISVGFCRLFCTFHSDFERIQIECLKNMDLKRVLINQRSTANPMQYLPGELREQFVSLAGHYRIGYYSNAHDVKTRPLSAISTNHRENPPSFGFIRLPSVKNRIINLVRSIDSVCFEGNSGLDGFRSPGRGRGRRGHHHHSMVQSPPSHHPFSMSSTSKSIFMSSSTRKSRTLMMATSPNTTNTSDDAMVSSPNSFTPSGSSFIMSQMLSDME